MKKLIATAMFVLMTLTAWQSNAQTTASNQKAERKAAARLDGDKVSSMAKDHFLSDFGNVDNVKWKRGQQFDEATFTKNGQQMTAYYDYQFNLVGTTAPSKFSALPANAQKEIAKMYKGYTTGAVILFDDNDVNDTNMLIYGREFDDNDNYFVELSKDNKQIVVQVKMDGEVSYFKEL
jgi:hypothetical protein